MARRDAFKATKVEHSRLVPVAPSTCRTLGFEPLVHDRYDEKAKGPHERAIGNAARQLVVDHSDHFNENITLRGSP